VESVFSELCSSPPDLVAASANGTFIDHAEAAAIRKHSPEAKVYAPKAVLGESVGASALWQTIVASQALITQDLPGLGKPRTFSSAIVSTCGVNQQVAGLRLGI
jgi:3-oxoacyl-(acyl-carrier-protein) synthase